MDAGDVLILPQHPRHAVVGEQDFLGFPFVGVEQMFEIVGGLVHVQHQGMMNISHRASPRYR